jgi:predicted dehydrogenase
MGDRTRIGIVGLKLGQWHVETIAAMPDAVVAAVAENNPANVGGDVPKYAAQIGARAYSDGVEMMEKETLDAVSLCVSPKWRGPLMAKAAEKGLPMLVEKPFATNMEHGRQLVDICQKRHAVVMMEFPLRYLPCIARLRELMDGELGKGVLVNGDLVLGWLPPATHWMWDPNNGNGFINENTCHLFDTVCHLMDAPVSLHAEGDAYFGTAMESGVAMTVKFVGGGAAALTAGGVGARVFDQPTFLSVCTAHGQARVTGPSHMYDTLVWARRDAKRLSRETWELPPRRQIMRYAMRHFVDCVKSGQKPSAGLADGMRALALAMAVRESLTRKAPVPVVW